MSAGGIWAFFLKEMSLRTLPSSVHLSRLPCRSGAGGRCPGLWPSSATPRWPGPTGPGRGTAHTTRTPPAGWRGRWGGGGSRRWPLPSAPGGRLRSAGATAERCAFWERAPFVGFAIIPFALASHFLMQPGSERIQRILKSSIPVAGWFPVPPAAGGGGSPAAHAEPAAGGGLCLVARLGGRPLLPPRQAGGSSGDLAHRCAAGWLAGLAAARGLPAPSQTGKWGAKAWCSCRCLFGRKETGMLEDAKRSGKAAGGLLPPTAGARPLRPAEPQQSVQRLGGRRRPAARALLHPGLCRGTLAQRSAAGRLWRVECVAGGGAGQQGAAGGEDTG